MARAPVPILGDVPASGRFGWATKVVLEVVLISLGVFLALMGEQWREAAANRELARQSLERFRVEILANQKSVMSVKDYHATMLPQLQKFIEADDKAVAAQSITLEGLQPAFFEDTAWELAVATQSLTHIDPEIAYGLSRIYNLQGRYEGLTAGVTAAMYLRPASEPESFFPAVATYFGDVVFFEPELLSMYSEILSRIDAALR
jgi:hypothetical protein